MKHRPQATLIHLGLLSPSPFSCIWSLLLHFFFQISFPCITNLLLLFFLQYHDTRYHMLPYLLQIENPEAMKNSAGVMVIHSMMMMMMTMMTTIVYRLLKVVSKLHLSQCMTFVWLCSLTTCLFCCCFEHRLSLELRDYRLQMCQVDEHKAVADSWHSG